MFKEKIQFVHIMEWEKRLEKKAMMRLWGDEGPLTMVRNLDLILETVGATEVKI